MDQPALKDLIKKFMHARRDEQSAYWIQGDIAVMVHDQFGRKGMRQLAQTSGISMLRLRSLRYTANKINFDLRHKYAALSATHFRVAASISARFEEGTKEADPEWWLQQARERHLTCNQLNKAAQLQPPTDRSTLKGRMAWLEKRAVAAGRAYKEIERAIAMFNQEHAVYFGSTLDLQAMQIETNKAS